MKEACAPIAARDACGCRLRTLPGIVRIASGMVPMLDGRQGWKAGTAARWPLIAASGIPAHIGSGSATCRVKMGTTTVPVGPTAAQRLSATI
jgi:hypothetical protein